jgi:hypothetical protein
VCAQPQVGRGHVSLKNNLDTWQCKPFIEIGHSLIHAAKNADLRQQPLDEPHVVHERRGVHREVASRVEAEELHESARAWA